MERALGPAEFAGAKAINWFWDELRFLVTGSWNQFNQC